MKLNAAVITQLNFVINTFRNQFKNNTLVTSQIEVCKS